MASDTHEYPDLSQTNFVTCIRVKADGTKGSYDSVCLEAGIIGVGFTEGLRKGATELVDVDGFHTVPNVPLQEQEKMAKERLDRMADEEKNLVEKLRKSFDQDSWEPTEEELEREVAAAKSENRILRKKLTEATSRAEIITTLRKNRLNKLPSRAAAATIFANLRAGDWVVLLGPGNLDEDWSTVRAIGQLVEGAITLKPGMAGQLQSYGAHDHVLRKVAWRFTNSADSRAQLKALRFPQPHNNRTISLIGPGWQESARGARQASEKLQANTGQSEDRGSNKNDAPRRPDQRGSGNWLYQLLSQPHAPRCLILEGVPGTTKTYALAKFRQNADLEKYGAAGDGKFAITLHPATAYEDFVEGLRPTASHPPHREGPSLDKRAAVNAFQRLENGTLKPLAIARPFYQTLAVGDQYTTAAASDPPLSHGMFQVCDGFFFRCCVEAVCDPSKKFIVLLDEINRCNIPKVFGDLLTTIEQSKRARWVTITEGGETKQGWDLTNAQTVTLPYSGRTFFVPDNIIVVGTMNTTDRSVAPMDAALRRRFAFMRVWPFGFGPTAQNIDTEKILNDEDKLNAGDLAPYLRPSVELWLSINKRLHAFGDDALLGHSYLFALKDDLAVAADDQKEATTIFHWNHYIFPQVIDIVQSNDLEAKVFGGVKLPTGQLSELRQPSADSPGLFDNTLPKSLAGKWTRRGEGMLRTLTLRLTMPTSAEATTQANQAKADAE
jgi:hypothetical protein